MPSWDRAGALRGRVVRELRARLFHAYRSIAERDELDAVIHLGDYIYEYASGAFGMVRSCEPQHEIVSLDDYRQRYAHCGSDPDLRELHRRHPMIAVWDDHEIANNAWLHGAENHKPEQGDYDALRAYFEWMPLRESAEGGCFRQFAYGDLVDLIMLDTRLWGRDQQIGDVNDARFMAEDREIHGGEQAAWLADALQKSKARWRLLGQQVMVGRCRCISIRTVARALRLRASDSWSCWRVSRRRIAWCCPGMCTRLGR